MRGTRGLLALAAVAAVLAVALSGRAGSDGWAREAADSSVTTSTEPLAPAAPDGDAPRVVTGGAFMGEAIAPGERAPSLKLPVNPEPCGPAAPLEVSALAAPLPTNGFRITAFLTPRYNETRELTVEFGLPEGVTPLPGQSLTRICDGDPFKATVVTLDVVGPPGLHQIVVHGWEHIGGRNNVSAVATVDVVMP